MTGRQAGLHDYLRSAPDAIRHGPVALILIEDGSAIDDTIRHHLRLGFRHILALSPEPVALADGPDPRVATLIYDTRRPAAHVEAVNALIAAAPEGTWLYYCFNAEFLFFPFLEHRRIGEMLTFHAEERRGAMLTYVIDLYAPDLARCPDAVDLEEAMFDRSGYYALGLRDEAGAPLERQLAFHGGLRWRFEEHLPADRRRIDRIALFRPARACGSQPITVSISPNTTPMPVPGITI